MRILIAEDDFIISLVLENMVHRLGHEIVAVCRTGEETIRQIHTKKPDCILLDYQLEDNISGFDIMMKIRERLNTPFILISGRPSGKLDAKFRKLKPVSTINKPLVYNELKKALMEVKSRF